MNHHRYTLERYQGVRSRHRCPQCNKPRQFTRYIDTENGQYLADHVGRCNREIECGYHFKPKQFFASNKEAVYRYRPPSRQTFANRQSKPSVIEQKVFERSLRYYTQNNFVQYLHTLFDDYTVNHLIGRYHIGTSQHWAGATIFWQVDSTGRVRSGKVMLYDSKSGKRVKKPYNHITWIHKVLKLPDFQLKQCLFGEHLLSKDPYKPVAIVESEKTAIIASAYLPKFHWLAVGSLSNLSLERCQVLQGRKVFLFPDLGAYDKWNSKAKELGFMVSDLLEKKASNEERGSGFDIADYLVQSDYSYEATFYYSHGNSKVLEINRHGYPTLWDL